VISNEPSAERNTPHSAESAHIDKPHTTLDFRNREVEHGESRSRQRQTSSSSSAADTTVSILDVRQKISIQQKRKLPEISVDRDWLVTSGGQYTINDQYARNGEVMPSSNIGLRRVNTASHLVRQSATQWRSSAARDYHDDEWPTLWT